MSVREAEKGVIRGEVGIGCVALLALAVRWRAMVAVLHADSSFRHQHVAGAPPDRHRKHVQENKIRSISAPDESILHSLLDPVAHNWLLSAAGLQLTLRA